MEADPLEALIKWSDPELRKRQLELFKVVRDKLADGVSASQIVRELHTTMGIVARVRDFMAEQSGLVMDESDPLAALIKKEKTTSLRALKLAQLRKIKELLLQELPAREIIIQARSDMYTVANVRSLLGLKCPCGLPQGHQQKCSYQVERNLILNEGPVAKAISAFAADRYHKFLEKRPEVKMAVEHFQREGTDDFPEIRESLGKLARFGSMTERQAEGVVGAYLAVMERADEEAAGRASQHIGYNGQRLFRLKLKVISAAPGGSRSLRWKVTAVSEDGNVFVWFYHHRKPEMEQEGWFWMDCTVNGHVRIKGQRQTVVRHCSLRPEKEEEGPSKQVIAKLGALEAANGCLEVDDMDRLDLARAVQGDAEAFSRLAERYRKRMVLTAEWVIGNADAEDIVQESLVRIWNVANRFKFGGCTVRAWMLTVAKQTAITELHAKMARRTYSLQEMMEADENGVRWEPSIFDPPWGGLFRVEEQFAA